MYTWIPLSVAPLFFSCPSFLPSLSFLSSFLFFFSSSSFLSFVLHSFALSLIPLLLFLPCRRLLLAVFPPGLLSFSSSKMLSSFGGPPSSSSSSFSADSPSSSSFEGGDEGEQRGGGGEEEVLCAVEFSKSSTGSFGSRGGGGGGGGASSRVGLGSVAAGVSVIGVCIFDRRTFKLQFCEFSINNDLSILEGLLLQVRPTCVISSEGSTQGEGGPSSSSSSSPSSSWEKKLEDLVDSCQADFVRVRRSACNTSSLHQDLGSLLHSEAAVKNHLSKELQLKTASAACASLISHARLLSDEVYMHQCTLEMYPLDLYLRIDAAASTALYLFPPPARHTNQHLLLPGTGSVASSTSKSTGGGTSAGTSVVTATTSAVSSLASGGITSIFSLIGRWTVTPLGMRRLFTCMSQPLVDPQQIERRYDIVGIFQNDEAFRREVFCNHFKHVFDLDRLSGRFHRLAAAGVPEDSDDVPVATKRSRGNIFSRVKVELEDLVKLYDCAVEAAALHKTLQGYEGPGKDSLDDIFTKPLGEVVSGFETFINLVEFTIDMDEAQRGCFVVSRRFEPQLGELLQQKEKIRSGMNRQRQKAEEEVVSFSGTSKKTRDVDVVRLIEDNTLGYVLRVTKKDQPAVQGCRARGKYQQIRLNKNEFIFTTPELKSLCHDYKEVCLSYDNLQKSLVEKAVLVASSYWPIVERLAELLGMIDVLGAFALTSANAPIPYVRPKILTDEGAGLRMKNCRHPLLEVQPSTTSFISNDVHFDRQRARLHIITGPNMGGKSTYIRQVALAVLLAQIGCFVPCEACELPIFRQVICRVGASDIQLKGVSTFLAEMIEASAILRNANEESLVIIDELGRGTSTYEGFGLAWSIAKHLASSIRCFCLFATHFHEMSQLAEEVEGVCNFHVSAAIDRKKQKLTFLYQLAPGCIDQSYGVHVAEFAGLPSAVVERAREKSNELEAVERDEKETSFLNQDKKRRRLHNALECDAKPRREEEEEKRENDAEEEERKTKMQKRERKREAFESLKSVLKRLFGARDPHEFVKNLHEEKSEVERFYQASAPEFLLRKDFPGCLPEQTSSLSSVIA